jgi:predicted PurR-regulated permease PerM
MRRIYAERNGYALGLFVKKVALFTGMAGVAIAAWLLHHVILIFFGALVLSIGMNAAARLIASKLRIRYAAGLSLVLLAGTALIFGIGWFFGAAIGEQLDEVTRRVPAGLQWFADQMEKRPYARDLLTKLQKVDLAGTTGWVAATLAAIARSSAVAAGSLVAMAIIAVYLAAQPERYRAGALRLVPPSTRLRVSKLFDATSNILGRWLIGQLAVMATVGILSGLGLWALGIKAALVLGLVGGLLSFVPYVGAVIAAVPATLFALAQGPSYALAVIAMYVAVHFIEGNFITPVIQSEATSLPPVVTLLSVISCGLLLGPSAVFLAAPLALFLGTAIQVLYVEPMIRPKEWSEIATRSE